MLPSSLFRPHPWLRLGLLIALVALLGVGCKRRSWHRIPNGKLQTLLTELYTARGIGQALYLTPDEQDSLYTSILRTHKVSQEDLDSTIYYLSASKAKVLQKIIAQSSSSIQRKVAILERNTGFSNLDLSAAFGEVVEEEHEYFYMPLSDSISCRVTALSPYPIQINEQQHSYRWQIALADIPNLPETIREVEIQGLISDTRLPSQYQMPYIALSKQLDGTHAPFGSESVSTQLPFGGQFRLTLVQDTESSMVDMMTSDDSLTVATPPSHMLHFSASDTISVSIYAPPTDYLSKTALRFKLHDLRIIAR